MTIDLLSADWSRFAEKLRQNGYALLRAANPKLLVTDKGAADPNIIRDIALQIAYAFQSRPNLA